MRFLLLCAVLLLAVAGAATALALTRGRGERVVQGAERAAQATRDAARAARDSARSAREEPPRAGRRPLRPVRCADGVVGCRLVTGRVVLVESVDPDGDGDLHVVLAAGSVTAPGLTAVDVSPALRPRRDPRVGERFSAAGPVQRGSYGQEQIHALDVAVAGARPAG